MSLGKVSLGLIVIFIGVFILLDNLDILNFSWSAVIYFWPVLVILAGVNLLLPKRMEGQVLSIMATVIVLLFFAYQGLKSSRHSWMSTSRLENIVKGDELSLLSREYDQSVNEAELTISGGAVEYTLVESTDKLIDIEGHSSISSFSLSSNIYGDNAKLDFTQKGNATIKNKELRAESKATIRLNANPVWDIKLEIGAGTARFDLTPFKVRNLTIEGGVSAIKVKIGMPGEETTKVDFEGGVSSLDIEVPLEAGCIIHAESALSSLSFPGFSKQEDGSYRSDNFEGAHKKVEIKLENGLSSIKVKRY